MSSASWTVGVDFGGTNIKVGAVRSQGTVACKMVLPTRAHASPERFIDGIERAIHRLGAACGARRSRLRGVGIGAPGLIDGRRGIIRQLVNVPGGWRGVPLKRLLERRLGCPCAVENDVNVVALGEWRFGAGRGTRDSLYVTLGTGVGGGVVSNGSLVRGATGSAGEIGHTVLRPDGPRCACGSRGCLEAFVGTPAILRRARRAARASRGALAAIVTREPGRLSPASISQAAKAGDPAARRVWREIGRDLGAGLASAINLLNPERIVIGGGIAKAWPWFSASLMATVRARAFGVPVRACRIVRAQLGDAAGIIGAAMLVWEQEKR